MYFCFFLNIHKKNSNKKFIKIILIPFFPWRANLTIFLSSETKKKNLFISSETKKKNLYVAVPPPRAVRPSTGLPFFHLLLVWLWWATHCLKKKSIIVLNWIHYMLEWTTKALFSIISLDRVYVNRIFDKYNLTIYLLTRVFIKYYKTILLGKFFKVIL